MRPASLLFAFLLLASICAPPAHAQPKPDPKKAVTDPAQADADFAVQGEYQGWAALADGYCGQVGLQVVALGGGKFQALAHHGGLPGYGWLGDDRAALAGRRDERGTLALAGDKLPGQTITVAGGQAIVRGAGCAQGTLCKVHRQSPTMGAVAPACATVLFDGGSAEHFIGAKVSPEGLLEVGGTTKNSYGDFYLHLEFRTPYMPYATGQGRGNSGVYVQERYEVQILDSFGLEGAFNECGALYRSHAPNLNMCLPPLAWQTYDIWFTAAKFDAQGKKTADAVFTVRHNGVLIHDHLQQKSKTGAGRPEGPDSRPIKLQNHGNPVQFRNIWIVEGAAQPEVSSPGRTPLLRRLFARRRR